MHFLLNENYYFVFCQDQGPAIIYLREKKIAYLLSSELSDPLPTWKVLFS